MDSEKRKAERRRIRSEEEEDESSSRCQPAAQCMAVPIGLLHKSLKAHL